MGLVAIDAGRRGCAHGAGTAAEALKVRRRLFLMRRDERRDEDIKGGRDEKKTEVEGEIMALLSVQQKSLSILLHCCQSSATDKCRR